MNKKLRIGNEGFLIIYVEHYIIYEIGIKSFVNF